jgi:hypothetical protein
MHIIVIWYFKDHSIHSVYFAAMCFLLALVLVITIVYPCFSVCPYHAAYSSGMQMEAASFSETAAYYCITQWHILKDSNLPFFPLSYMVKIFKLLNFTNDFIA